MASKKKAPTIKAAKKAESKKPIETKEQPDETEKNYEDPFFEQLPEENIIQNEPSIADILKRNKK